MGMEGDTRPAEQSHDQPIQGTQTAPQSERFWDLKASHWVEVFLTGVLIWVGCLQYRVYTRQANIMDAQTVISVSGQRAFVYLDKIEAKWLDTKTAKPGMVVNVTFKIENSGNTPSRDLRMVAGCYPLGPVIPREPFEAFHWDDKQAAHLFIGAHQILDFPGCKLSESEIDPMQSSPFIQGRYLMGEIRYFDTVSDPPVERVAQFSYQLVFHSFNAKSLQLDYETLLVGNHNCGDDECKNAKGDPGPLAAPRWATY
jgi:hypothetical protein